MAVLRTFWLRSRQDASRSSTSTDSEQNVASKLSRFQRWVKRVIGASSGSERTEITIQTDQFLLVRSSRPTRGWCAECGREVDMLGLKEAGALGGAPQSPMSQPLLFGHEDARVWHWSHAPDGSPQVCLESVLKSGK
jgi:hypothetical protein